MKLIITSLFTILITNCFSQKIEEISTSEGLSHPYVYQIYQTKDSFIWVSTNGGLNRYDGYNFKVLRNKSNNPFTITDDRTKALLEDHQGRLWMTTQSGGLNLLDRKTQKVYHSKIILPKYSSENNITGWRLLQDKEGNIWMGGSMSTLFKISIPKKWGDGYPKNADFKDDIKIEAIELKNEIKDLKHLLLDGNILWVGSSNGRVFSYNLKTFQIKEYSLPTISGLGDPSAITGFYRKSQGNIIISTFSEGIFEIKNESVSTIYKPSQKTDFWIDEKGFVWLKTIDNKVFRVYFDSINSLDTQNGQPVFFSKSRSYKSFLNLNNDIVFLGDVRGVKKVNLQKTNFKHILAETDNYAVFKAKNGKIFVRNSNIFSEATEQSLGKPYFKEFKNGKFYQAKNGTVWVAAEKEPISLLKYDEELRFVKEFPLPNYNVNHLPVFCEDNKGNLWIATIQGSLYWFNPKTEQSMSFSYKNIIPETDHVHLGEPLTIFEGSEGSIWILTEDALIEVKRKDKQLIFKRYDSKNSSIQGINFQFAIEDPFDPNYIWVSTKEVGFQKWHKHGDVVKVMNLDTGLPNLSVVGLLEDSNHNFWVSCSKGIYRINPKTYETKVFGKMDGLQGLIFNKLAFHKTLSGEMLFAGNNGVNVFHPDSIRLPKELPNIKITKIEVNNKTIEIDDENKILEKTIEDSEEISLEYNQNTIKLFFSVLDFTNASNNIYRFQLEGIDKSLVEAGTEHTATYVSLPIGSHVFKLYGSISGGEWNKKPILLKINILPPWYRTWWAYLLYLLLVSYLAYRFYEFQINKVKLNQELAFNQIEKQQLAELNQIKTNFFTNISHELRTPLTLLVGPVNDLKQKYPQESIITVMQRNLHRLQTLINQLLDLSKLEVNEMKVNLQEVNLSKFFEQLFASFESMAQSKHIIFNHSQNKFNQFAKADVDKIEKIVSNLLSNAFKFTYENGRIIVRIEYLQDSFTLLIQDSGIGIDADSLDKIFDRFYQVDDTTQRLQEGTGIGLALVKELVELLGGKIEVESKLGEGTIFNLVLPYISIEKLTENHSLYFPQHLLEGEAEVQNISTDEIQIHDDKPVMLIIEDNSDLRSYISNIFVKNFQIIAANDGLFGLERAIRFVPDIVISDLMMPKLDGLSFCEKLRSDERINHIPVILLTAKAGIADRLIGLEKGADDYLSKPFEKDELIIRVNNLVNQRSLLREKFSNRVLDEIEIQQEPTIDTKFIQKAKAIIDKNLDESTFDVEDFAREMNLSSVQLRRKLKALTDLSVTEFVRNHRLETAFDLLKKTDKTVSEIAYQVGFESLSYFSKVFFEKHGKTPSECRI